MMRHLHIRVGVHRPKSRTRRVTQTPSFGVDTCLWCRHMRECEPPGEDQATAFNSHEDLQVMQVAGSPSAEVLTRWTAVRRIVPCDAGVNALGGG